MANLREGSRGPQVRALQEKLVEQGYFVGTVDDIYGKKLGAAVSYFQSVNGLRIDGIAGEEVQSLLGIGEQPGAVEMALPAADARISNMQYDVRVHSRTETDVRVVVWFRVGAEQVNAEATVHVPADGDATAEIPIPESVQAAEAEVHVHAQAWLPGQTREPADEKASHFWVDRV